MTKLPTEKIEITLYRGEVKIEFTPGNHRYKVNGEYIRNSVSSVSGIVDKGDALKWWACKCMAEELKGKYLNGEYNEKVIDSCVGAFMRVSKTATDIGTQVHDFCEKYAQHQIFGTPMPVLPKDEKALAGALAFLRWVKDSGVEFLYSEKLVYSRLHNYVGKFDSLYKLKICPRVLGDYKTSKAFYEMEMGMQTAGYQIAEEEEKGQIIGMRQILRFDKETGIFDVHTMAEHERDKKAFLNALALRNHKLAIEDAAKKLAKETAQ